MFLLRLHLDPAEKPPQESFLFLDRPIVPDLLKATEIAPQFCSESLRIDALCTGRRQPLAERFAEQVPVTS